MPRRHPIVPTIVFGIGLCIGTGADAQGVAPVRVVARTATTAGLVHGLVKDIAGRAVADASIMAVGQTVISARSDVSGRFTLTLPPGDYVLRASRDGYLSNYREPVRVVSTTLLERNITLTRQAGTPTDVAAGEDHSHSETAWRLRHLTRSVLRDGAGAVPIAPGQIRLPERATDVRSRFALALAGTDFRGQVNFVTTAVAGPLSAWGPDSLPRGVAFFTLGAPVVGHGAWQMQGAVASGDGSSWNLFGAYQSDAATAHTWKLGLSYSAQGYTRPAERLTAAVAEARSVAGIAGQDRWRVMPGLDVDYGVRAERFDYLVDPQLFSANAGFALRVLPRTALKVNAARRMIAPGADEFLPPPTGAPWLPAERTFYPLNGRGTLRAEDVRHAEIAVTHAFGTDHGAANVQLRRFRQRASDQIATLFGAPGTSPAGQYFVAHVGTVDLVGWGLGFEGRLSKYVSGAVEYSRVTAEWQAGRRTREIRRAAPSVLRPDLEASHDVTATLEADLVRTATHVSLVYRGSTAFSQEITDAAPVPGSRFDLQVRQALPYQPTRGSRLELLFSIRNLFRDVRGDASWYDELLTAGSPLRLMGGIQVRF